MIRDFIIKLSGNDFRESKKGTEIQIRCPICGDSKKDKTKKRFYYNLDKNTFFCFRRECKGGIKTLINKFPNIPGVDYEKLLDYIKNKEIEDFINPNIEEHNIVKKKYELIYPDGSILDYVIDNKKYLEEKDIENLDRVINYLNNRNINKNWYRYFYFPFSGERYENCILTLMDWNGEWVWSARKIFGTGPKYINLKHYPFHDSLGFSNEISKAKGDIIYITEGWFDALILNQEGFNAVCVFGISNMKYNHKQLKKYKKDYRLVFVPDNDSTLIDFYNINKHYAEFVLVKLLKYKDVNEMKNELLDNFKKEFNNIKIFNVKFQLDCINFLIFDK